MTYLKKRAKMNYFSSPNIFESNLLKLSSIYWFNLNTSQKRIDSIQLIESILTRALYIPIHFVLSQHFSFFLDKKFFELLDNPREINGHAGHYIHQVNWLKNGMFPLKIKKVHVRPRFFVFIFHLGAVHI